jgi:hypothetical protein
MAEKIIFYEVPGDFAEEVAYFFAERKYGGRFPLPNGRRVVIGYVVDPNMEELDFLALKTGLTLLDL